MKQVYRSGALVSLAMLLLVSCQGTSALADGTVTVGIVDDTIATAHGLAAYAYAAGETALDTASSVVACQSHQVFGGTTSFLLELDDGAWEPNGTIWMAPGGSSYDLYVYTVDDGGVPGPGDYMTNPMPIRLSIDGDMTIIVDFDDMVPYVSP